MSKYKCSLLVVDDEPYILPTLSALLAGDFEVVTADSGEAAAGHIFAHRKIDLILTDQKMPRMAGVELLEWVREHSPKTVRLLMTGYAELEDAVEAINRGQVYYYLLKPWLKSNRVAANLGECRGKVFPGTQSRNSSVAV